MTAAEWQSMSDRDLLVRMLTKQEALEQSVDGLHRDHEQQRIENRETRAKIFERLTAVEVDAQVIRQMAEHQGVAQASIEEDLRDRYVPRDELRSSYLSKGWVLSIIASVGAAVAGSLILHLLRLS